MKQVLKYTGYILLIALAGFLIWRFWYMIVWILVAAIISFIGIPLVRLIDRIHIKRWEMPHSLSALFSLLIIILALFGLLAIFVPLIVQQAETISKINITELAENFQGPIQWLDDKAHAIGIISAEQTFQDYLVIKAKSVVNIGNVTAIINKFFGVAGTVLVGFFSILFIAFFFLKDEHLFEDGVLLFVPEKNHSATRKVIHDSKKMLMRYFIGVLLEVLGVMTIITIGLWVLGVDNALLIGFFGGIMNLIPYLGPVLGTLIGLTLGMTTTLATGNYHDIVPVLLKLIGVFLVANAVDNNVLVPLIYSKSVKSHPLEIFFIIIIGGSLAGILGMLVAIPVYTILRVIAREFFQQFRVVKKLTESIDQD